MNNPLISIIVPVYNVELYLRKCLDSILSQAYTNWEAILVDDGSTDKSGAICDEFAKKDCRFKVIQKENGGVSSARNCGITEARGEWCCFIDSDDWIEPTYLQNFLVEGYAKYGCVLQSFFRDYESGHSSKLCSLAEGEMNSSSELVYYLEFAPGVHNGYLWHRLFRLKVIKENKLEFILGISFAEDGIFFLNYLLYANNFYITQNAGYHHFVRSNSLTSSGNRLPINTLCFTLENYALTTSKIIKKDNPGNVIANGLRLFIWRLLYQWILIRFLKSIDDYYCNINFVSESFKKYHVTDVKTTSLSLKLLIQNVSKSPTKFRYYVINILCVVYNVECRLKRSVKRIWHKLSTRFTIKSGNGTILFLK